jgi:hypothetical protein
MGLLAHWKIGNTPGDTMDGLPAVDSAAGGAGAHNGIYKLGTSRDSLLLPYGTDEYLSLGCSRSVDYGYIHTFSNVEDFQDLHGEMTVAAWIMRLEDGLWSNNMYVAACGNTGATSDDNYSFSVMAYGSKRLRFQWHYGTKTVVDVTSTTNILPDRQRPVHIGFVRYEVAAGFYGVRFYVDGALADTQDNGGAGWAAPTGGGLGLMYVGRTANGQPGTDFRLDSVRIYDSAEDGLIPGIASSGTPYWEPAGCNIAPSLSYVERIGTFPGTCYIGERSGRDEAGFHTGGMI